MAIAAEQARGFRPVRTGAPWTGVFTVDGYDGGAIDLDQIDRSTFALGCKIVYTGEETGLEDLDGYSDFEDALRTFDATPVPGEEETTTDLASVPGPLRWFLGSYGVHTPAVLIHDRLIPTPPDMVGRITEQQADRYMRFMLKALGVRWLKRWIMWAGVALRTRFASGGWERLSVVIWILAALAGISTLFIAALAGNSFWFTAALIAPFGFAVLWDRQFGAGLIAAMAAPWLLPPTLLALLGYGIYVVLEGSLGWVFGKFAGTEGRGTGSLRVEGY